MSCKTFASTGVVCLLLAAANAAYSQEKPKGWWESITLNGFASVSYAWNFNDPKGKLTQLRSFDYDHNSFRVDGAELVLQRAAVNRGDFGFRIDFAAGAVARIGAARGLFRDTTTGQALDIDLQQAFVSYIIPLGRGLRVDFGKFVTPIGAELIDGYDGFNDNFSRSWLFTYGPFTHAGFKLSYSFHDMFSATVLVLNGWDNVVDNNAGKTYGLSLAITPTAKFSLYLNYMTGPERDNIDGDFRHLVDMVAVYKPTKRLTLMANFDVGIDQNSIEEPVDPLMPMAAPVKRDAKWLMAVLYIRVNAHARFSVTARGELFYDFDGNRTGTPQRLISGTLTPEVKVLDQLYFRCEGRIDQSDAFVFERSDGGKRKYQGTVALNAIALF
jgi:hypothetical protein